MNQLTVVSHEGKLFTDSRDVAEMAEKRHSDLIRDIESYKSIIDQNADLRSDDYFIENQYTAGTGRKYKHYLLSKIGCDMVANKMTGEKGVLFTAAYTKKFEAMEKQNREVDAPIEKKENFEMQLLGVQYSTQILRVDETSKIKMLEKAHKQHNVSSNHLPSYVDEEVTKSLTALLKENGLKKSAAKINTKLIEAGFLVIKERPSTKGGTKEFKSLTEEGQKYGKNLLNPRNPKETQPHYYESTFSDLMSLVGDLDATT